MFALIKKHHYFFEKLKYPIRIEQIRTGNNGIFIKFSSNHMRCAKGCLKKNSTKNPSI
jgi:hypothetical protein